MLISRRLLLGFSIVISLAVIVGLVGISGINTLRQTSLSVYESHVLGLEYTGKAAAEFKEVRLSCRQVVINNFYDDLWGAYESKENFQTSVSNFRYWLECGMNVSSSDELTRFYARISEIFENDFLPRAEKLIAESIEDIPEHVESLYINVLLESLIEVGEQIETVIIGSMDLNTALVEQANSASNSYTGSLIIIQGALLLIAVIVALFTAVYVTKSIAVPINEAADILSKVAKGDFDARVKGEYKGELALIKNSVNETAAQLSVYLKEKLKEEKTRSFAAIFSIADAGIVILDKDGVISDWNKGAEKILGYSHDEVTGKTPKYFTPEETRYVFDKNHEEQRKGKHIINTEDVRIHKNGKLVTCSASQTPLFDSNGDFDGVAVIFHDVTEKKTAEQEVRRFAAIIESAEACIITTDKEFIIQGWNAGAENILGYTSKEIIGKTPHFFTPESEWEKIDDMNKQMLTGEWIGRTEILQKHKNNDILDCSVYYSPYFDQNGCFDGAVAVLHDISERKQMETELQEALQIAEEASKVKSTFLANMSHEIRTPMNAVISMTELLLEEKLTSRQHRYLMDIKISGANLLSIINDILDLSKIEAGKFEIVPVHFDFRLLLKNLCSTFDFITRDKHLEFICESDENIPPYIYADDIRMRQILTNLLSNAVKFTPKGYVKMRTTADRHNIYFEISDTGIGIKEDSINKLFDSFQQLDVSTNRKINGTGLGLPITKSLIEMMGGSISVESEYGKGTIFTVAIPRVDGNSDFIKDDTAANAIELYAPEASVLVVDDYDANLRVASGLLELSGIKCDTAINGETAINMVKEKQYDLVFMDHMMPGMDGVETMQGIREMGGKYKELPIVSLTANAISGVKEMLINQGMNDFLSKPIDRGLLAKILIKWLPKEKVQIQEKTDKENKKDQTPSALVKGLREISEIQMDSALELMGGHESLYESTFMITYRMLPENIKKLDDYLEKESLRDFAIEVHGLKGALNNIGCRILGDYAFELEKAAKEENKEYCKKNYEDFKRRILEFYENVSVIIGKTGQSEKKKGDNAFLLERLAQARYACEEYDSFLAYEILTELSGYDFSPDTGLLIDNALQAAENCDYDMALDFINQLEKLK